MCALLWLHPRRLGGNWLLWLLVAIASVSAFLDIGQWVPSFALAFRLPMVLVSVLLATVYALQWRAVRGDPALRAQLKWFGLLLFVSLSAVSVAYAIGAAGHVIW